MKKNIHQRYQAALALAILSVAAAQQANAAEQFRGLIDTALTTVNVPGIDPGAQQFRQMAGVPGFETTTSAMPQSTDAKGGLAKEPITTSTPALWEVYGSLYYYTEEFDQEFGGLVGTTALVPIYTRADTEIDVFGGLVGVERLLNPEWSAGFAVGYSEADTDLSINGALIGTIDTETLSLIPYLEFHRDDALGSADWWANFQYVYSDQSFDVVFLGVPGSTDGTAHTLKVNTGLNYQSGDVVHGPYAGLRYTNGEVDAFGGLPSADVESTVSILGYQASKHIALSGGTLVPQLRVAWEHEFEEGTTSVFGLPLAGNVDDVAVIGASLGMFCGTGWNAVLGYEAHIASEAEGHYVGVKVGKEF